MPSSSPSPGQPRANVDAAVAIQQIRDVLYEARGMLVAGRRTRFLGTSGRPYRDCVLTEDVAHLLTGKITRILDGPGGIETLLVRPPEAPDAVE